MIRIPFIYTIGPSPASASVNVAATTTALTITTYAAKVHTGFAAKVMSLNPVGYWRLGESSGPTAYDETGSHNGTYASQDMTYSETGLLSGDSNTCVKFYPTNDSSGIDLGFNTYYTSGTIIVAVTLDSTQLDNMGHIFTNVSFYATVYADFPISLRYNKASNRQWCKIRWGDFS